MGWFVRESQKKKVSFYLPITLLSPDWSSCASDWDPEAAITGRRCVWAKGTRTLKCLQVMQNISALSLCLFSLPSSAWSLPGQNHPSLGQYWLEQEEVVCVPSSTLILAQCICNQACFVWENTRKTCRCWRDLLEHLYLPRKPALQKARP